MLPVKEIVLYDDCKLTKDVYGSGEYNVFAYTYAYNFSKMRDAALEEGENLDRFLSRQILAGMVRRPVRDKLMFFYTPWPDPEYVIISVSSRSMKAKCQWLLHLIDYCSYGEEYLRATGKPFMYWDGKELHRIYEAPPKVSARSKYICDLGSSYGLTVSKAPAAQYREIARNRTENWEYSAVPAEEEEQIAIEGKQQVLHHSFYMLL